jgi:hypothetical protein
MCEREYELVGKESTFVAWNSLCLRVQHALTCATDLEPTTDLQTNEDRANKREKEQVVGGGIRAFVCA